MTLSKTEMIFTNFTVPYYNYSINIHLQINKANMSLVFHTRYISTNTAYQNNHTLLKDRGVNFFLKIQKMAT